MKSSSSDVHDLLMCVLATMIIVSVTDNSKAGSEDLVS